MYVRIAGFEGNADNWDERIAEVRGRMDNPGGEGERTPFSRAMMLVDRSSGRGASVMFCDSEEDLKKVDEFMNNMSPPAGTGTRTAVEMYEVAVDSEASGR
jgi:hypothetical protein